MKFRHTNINEDLNYRDHVVNNEEEYVNDFLSNFSKPILGYVGKEIMDVEPVKAYSFERKTYYMDFTTPIMGDYFMFIAAKLPGDEKDDEPPITRPQWDALRKYSAENNCSLFNYVNRITIRHFCKLPGKKAEKKGNTESDSGNEKDTKGKKRDTLISLFDIFDYLAKIFYDQELPYKELKENIINDLQNALDDLKKIPNNDNSLKDFRFDGKRDHRVLELCCMYNYSWIDVAEELQEYINIPISDPLEEISDKEKRKIQNRIALLKQRALQDFTKLIFKSDKYKCLKNAILQHKLNRKH